MANILVMYTVKASEMGVMQYLENKKCIDSHFAKMARVADFSDRSVVQEIII